jgi:thymidylate kinase/SAM-dependent methyltransferase
MSKSNPYIVEFSGMPKSGKSTIIEILSHYFRRSGYDVAVHRDAGTYAAIGKEKIGALNIFLASQAISFAMEKRHAKYPSPEIIFIDRGIFDRYVFSNTLYELGRIDSAEKTAVNSFLGCDAIARVTDRTFVLVTSVELSLQRELAHSLTGTAGDVMNSNFLSTYRRQSLNLADHHPAGFNAVETIDTDRLNNRIRETARNIAITIEEDLIEKSIACYKELKTTYRDNKFFVCSNDESEYPPYVVNFEGINYYRYMNKIYSAKKAKDLSPDEVVKLCDLRLDYIESVVDFDLNRSIAIEVAKFIRRKSDPGLMLQILDYGCGSGLSSLHLQKEIMNCKIRATDPSDKAIKIAANTGMNAVRFSSGEPFPFSNDQFDFVVSLFVLHFDIPEADLRSLREVLVDGGLFIFNLYNCEHDTVKNKLVIAGWSGVEQIPTPSLPDHHRLFFAVA